jgi:hypothetical protein
MIICQAIKAKKLIKFFYTESDSEKKSEFKTVEPYLIGYHRSTNNLVLRAYFLPSREQIAGGKRAGWRLYLIANISHLTVLNQTFIPRPSYKPNDVDIKMPPICRL